jgi:hypothetical protein
MQTNFMHLSDLIKEMFTPLENLYQELGGHQNEQGKHHSHTTAKKEPWKPATSANYKWDR